MQKFILGTLVALLSSGALASKSRIATLQGAEHLVDIQTVFINPAHLNLLNPYLTFEMGASGATNSPNAEGGFSKKLNSGNIISIYLGHDNTTTLRDGVTYLKQQNPIEVIYGTKNMGFGGSVSSVNNKKSGTKETTLVGKYGIVMDGGVSAYGNITLVSTAEQTVGVVTKKITASPGFTAGGSKDDGENRFFGSLTYGQAKKEEPPITTNYKNAAVQLGWLDHSLKNKDSDIYYGLRLDYSSSDQDAGKVTALALPAFIGIEYAVTNWATFRGSVSQNILLGSLKDGTAVNTDEDGINSNTTFAAGLGLKFASLSFDGSLVAASNGNVNGTSFVTNASVTYNF